MKPNRNPRHQRLLRLPSAAGGLTISIPQRVMATSARIALSLVAAGTAEITVPRMPTAGVLETRPSVAASRTLRKAVAGRQEEILQPQRDWFFANKAAIVAEHGGRYVAVSENSVVDTDQSLSRLVNRFYSGRGIADVYFGYAGEQEPAVGVPTYFA